MRRMSSRVQLVLAGVMGTLLPAVYAYAFPPCSDGSDTCAGRPGCSLKSFDHTYTSCSTATGSSGTLWCCNYTTVVYNCGDGTKCSVRSLSSQSAPCSC